MTRKTWPIFLGSFAVSAVLIAACNSGTDEGDDDDDTSTGGTANTTNPSNTGSTATSNNTGVATRGGANTNPTVATGGNRFGTATAQGSTTGRGGQTNAGGASANGGAKAGGAAGRGGTSATGGTKATAGNAGRAGSAGSSAKAGSVGVAGAGGASTSTPVAGNAGQTQKNTAGASGSTPIATGGTVGTGGAVGTAGSNGVAGNTGVAGTGNTPVACTDGCAGLTVPAGGTAEFIVGLSSVALTATSDISLTFYSNNAGAGTVKVVLYGAGATQCDGDTFDLVVGASGYFTVKSNISGCTVAGVPNVIGVGLVIANGVGATPVVVNVETLALENTTPAVAAWTFGDASSISTTATATTGKLYPKGGTSSVGTIAFVAAGS